MNQLPRLEDTFGRRFSYLRLSITDTCNFKCAYCLPNGYKKSECAEDFLSVKEITNLVRAFAEMGTWKVRLTGGEPTLRRDLLEIAQTVSQIPGIRKVALSTNGYRLRSLAPELLASGVTALNVSVDSLDRKRFEEITGSTKLDEILEGIESAVALGFESVKINAVLLAGWNDSELTSFTNWIRNKPVSVRFIELMPTAQNGFVFERHHVRSDSVRAKLLAAGWKTAPRSDAAGPAEEFTHPDYRGRLGIIAPYANHFCSHCNRLRITSQGGLRLCLFGEGDHPIRHLLQSANDKSELQANIRGLLNKKEISHYLPLGRVGNNHTFSAMGG